MKRTNKILAVLLSVAMLCGLIPAFSASTVSAAVGAIENGGFENDTTGWTVHNSTSIEKTHKNSGNASLLMPINNTTHGKLVAEQIVPVNRNGVYTLSFWIGVNTGNGEFEYDVYAGTDRNNCTQKLVERQRVDYKGVFLGSVRWEENTYENISVGQNTYIAIRFYAPSSGTRTHYLDDVTLTATTTGDATTHAKPSLTGFGTDKNQPQGYGATAKDPVNCTNNLIRQPGFEAATDDAQWNTTNFVGKQGVTIESDAGIARSGEKYLKYYHGSVGYTDWPMFEVAIEEGGDYVFSAWVRTPNLSANNVGQASIGIIDTDTGKFLRYGNLGGSYDGHYSTQEIQIRSTATDDKWHLRSVTFTAVAGATIKIGMYGLKSTMYVDDISVHRLSKGTKYEGDQKGTLSADTSNITNKYCETEDNLITDGHMTTELAEEFWTFGASGWNNGFLEFAKDTVDTSRGNTLHFKSTNPANNKRYRYIKFVSVEPDTKYTVSFDYRVVKKGSPLMFIDNNIVKNETFHIPDLGPASNSWTNHTFTFTTGNYNRIGIVFKDVDAEAYFDDFYFFKGEGVAEKPDETLESTLKHDYLGDSKMEIYGGTLGVAFKFELDCTGVTLKPNVSRYTADYTNAIVRPFGRKTECKLIGAGAVMTNNETVGTKEGGFTLEDVNGKTVTDIHAQYLFEKDVTSSIVYAVRITNIPKAAKQVIIYTRPYYIYEMDTDEDGVAERFTVYGDVQFEAYENPNDVNDGTLDWDW